MEITKKEISEKVICTRGTGFNPNWKYYVEINGIRFRKEYIDSHAYTDDRRVGAIGEAGSKKEFVNRVYEYLIERYEEALQAMSEQRYI